MRKIERCYNCGKELLEGQGTKEHIPAKALFNGYDSKYKDNRITVPACFDCNNKYSITDEEFRNMIGISSNRKENDFVTVQSVKSIMRKSPDLSRLRFDLYGKVTGVEFCENHIIDFHKKNFKGIFYYQYGYPLPDDYDLIVNIDENDHSEFTSLVIGYLNEYFQRKCSGHKDIFSYCLQPFRYGLKKNNREDLELEENENIIVGALIYNKQHGALVYAIRKEYLEHIGKSHICEGHRNHGDGSDDPLFKQ